MRQDILKIKRKISKANNFLLVCHKKPDIDTLGSTLAFSLYLTELKKNFKIFCIDEIIEDFKFLTNVDLISNDQNILKEDFDLIICFDIADLHMIGLDLNNFIFDINKIVNIDHHSSNTYYGCLNLVNCDASSTTIVVYDYLKTVGFNITPFQASCLLSGIYSDTGSFKHSNTNSKSYEVAFELLNLGASLSNLNRKKKKDKNVFSLWSKVFDSTFLSKSNVLISLVRQTDFINTETTIDDLSGIVEYLNMVPNVNYSLLLVEMENGLLKGSLRTKNDNIDLSKIAKKLGGGGHKGASGFTISAKYQLEKNISILSDDLSKTLLCF